MFNSWNHTWFTMASNCILQHRRWIIKLINVGEHPKDQAGLMWKLLGQFWSSAVQYWPTAPGLGICSSHQSCRKPMQCVNSYKRGKRFTACWKDCYQTRKRKKEKDTEQEEPAATVSASPLHFMLVFQVWTELGELPNSFWVKGGFLKPPQNIPTPYPLWNNSTYYFNPIKCLYTNPSPFPSTFPQGIWHLSSVFPQVTRTVPQVSPHATGTTQLYSHAQERTKLWQTALHSFSHLPFALSQSTNSKGKISRDCVSTKQEHALQRG